MRAFGELFLDVERRESLAWRAIDPQGRPATFLFREFYCDEPRCDCRRVVLLVIRIEEQCVVASINYGFEKPRRRDEPQIFLDPMNPQSELSETLLDIFQKLLASDPEHRARMMRHYAMWKRVVDDPSHPDHAKVRSRAHDDPSFRPAFPRQAARRARRGPPRKPAAAGPQSLALLGAVRGGESKARQRFRKLLDRVERLRRAVLTWREGRAAVESEVAAYCAVQEAHTSLCRDIVVALDRLYTNPALSKPERRKVRSLIRAIAREVIEAGGYDELKPLYKRHSRNDFDAEMAAQSVADARVMKSMAEMFGLDFGDADVSSMEKLRAYVEEHAAEERGQPPVRRARRKPTARQRASEARRVQEAESASKALQEVYRKLAMALHPDREQDVAERARKTELMQAVNVAYEARDLLTLLELQLRVEQVDPSRADAIAEERLGHYNRVLAEQAEGLVQELQELEGPWRPQLDVGPRAKLSPEMVIAHIRADTDDLRQDVEELRGDLSTIQEVRGLRAWLKAQAAPDWRQGRDADLFG